MTCSHPPVFMTHLWSHGMYVYMYVCMYKHIGLFATSWCGQAVDGGGLQVQKVTEYVE